MSTASLILNNKLSIYLIKFSNNKHLWEGTRQKTFEIGGIASKENPGCAGNRFFGIWV